MSHKRLPYSRRDFLCNAGSGLGSIALASMLASDGFLPKAAAADAPDPLRPKPPHFKPTPKSVIWMFMEGGPSHVDLFDYKPALYRIARHPMRAAFCPPITARRHAS